MSHPTPREVFERLVEGVCAADPELHLLYAESIDVRHPLWPGEPLRTREELRKHFAGPPDSKADPIERRPVDIVVHETGDPEVIVAEFAYAGRNLRTGREFRVPCVFVMRVRDGLIVESRDYIDHVGSAAARGMFEEAVALRRGQ
ncbi:hypothetical protein Afil01_13770 [Actinorhabdospora filicis]|uniref:SnoaL-like domain-containing protein n=1 Tax=Actinorhabdospora filicis TaxID=1785913 RepID=A0A9W6SG76_9ACTN|nr:nuclear transport factor 2 family protein [Actinorhabdospora filicis]GLZ76570.1 hypothetical protein Afil01_13770 [Actinorhabdospora filicis]